MRFTADQDTFSEALSFIIRMSPAKPSSSALSGVLIKARESELSFSSFDYEVSANIIIPVTIESEGEALIPGVLLNSVANRLPKGNIEVSIGEGKLYLACGSVKFSLSLMPLDGYPAIPRVKDELCALDGQEFLNALSQVVPSASKDDMTLAITSVMLEIDSNHIELIATDRYRVAYRSLQNPGSLKTCEALVPAKILADLTKNFSKSDSIQLGLEVSEERKIISFSTDKKTVTSLLLNGQYPPVKKLFPKEIDRYAVFSSQEVIEATRRVSLVLERDAALLCEFKSDRLELSAVGSNLDEAVETVECDLVGDPVSIKLRPQFLIDGLNACQATFTQIGFTKTESSNRPGPVLITPKLEKDVQANFRYLLQPNLFN